MRYFISYKTVCKIFDWLAVEKRTPAYFPWTVSSYAGGLLPATDWITTSAYILLKLKTDLFKINGLTNCLKNIFDINLIIKKLNKDFLNYFKSYKNKWNFIIILHLDMY